MDISIISMAVNTILLAVAIYTVKLMLSNFTKSVKESIDDLKKENGELWSALNTHGHKGLDENGSRVTR